VLGVTGLPAAGRAEPHPEKSEKAVIYYVKRKKS